MLQTYTFVAFFASLGLQTSAFPFGSGADVCEDGSPGGTGSATHGSLGSGNGGFSLAFSPALPSPSTYNPGTEYAIELSGGDFVGFAISPLTSETGTLSPGENSKTLSACTDFSDDDGLTHRSSAIKTSATGTWTAPATGTAVIRWTVLDNKPGTWFIDTITLTAVAVITATPTAAPTVPPTTTPTAAPTKRPTPLPPGATFAPTPTPTAAPTLAPTSPTPAPTDAPTVTPASTTNVAPTSSQTTSGPLSSVAVATLPTAVLLLVVTCSAVIFW